MSLLQAGFGSSAAAYQINKSLRLRNSVSAYLNRTFGASPTNAIKWTYSVWLKLSDLDAYTARHLLFGNSSNTDANYTRIGLNSSGQLAFSGYNTNWRITSRVFRDPTAFYHFVVVYDSANATAGDRVKIYVNGVQETSFATSNNPAQNLGSGINKASTAHYINRDDENHSYLDGYLSEINFIDGQALDASNFGEFNSDGVWVPKKYAGTYGTNGFYLDFKNGTSTTTLGYDVSGNSNHWTLNNISLTAGVTYDWMSDTPTNNYCTLNPLDKGSNVSTTVTNGGLTGSSTVLNIIRGSTGVSSGKWYWEFKMVSDPATSTICGVMEGNTDFSNSYPGGTSSSYGYYATSGYKFNNASGSAYGNSFAAGDTIGVALDMDAGKMWFSKNGTWQASGDPTNGINPAFTGLSGVKFPCHGNAASGTATVSYTFGQQPFAYTPPAGFKALCTENLPAGSITTSGTFTGNANAEGPFFWLNGNPEAMTINGNAVTFGTHADKTAGGFKVRTSSTSYNASGSNTFSVSSTGKLFGDTAHAPNTAKGNP